MSMETDTKVYFEAIGAWPAGSRHVGRGYALGFILSLILTAAAYIVIVRHVMPATDAVALVVALACVQFFVQMRYFFHFGRGATSRERLVVLLFAASIVAILVGGSIWIMNDLNGRMMPSDEQMEQYMDSQAGI